MGEATRCNNIDRINAVYGTRILVYLTEQYQIEEPEGLILCTDGPLMYAEYHRKKKFPIMWTILEGEDCEIFAYWKDVLAKKPDWLILEEDI